MMSLLIVDDEVIIADCLYEMLQEAFADRLVVYRRYSALDARALMENERIDILLTDINMPETSGLTLHQWASRRWPFMKVIYLTGYSNFQYAQQALRQQAFDYVLKSDGDGQIIETIENAMKALTDDAKRLLDNPLFAQARPLYIREMMDQLLYQPKIQADQIEKNLLLWNIPLRLEKHLMLALCIFREPNAPLHAAMDMIESLMKDRFRLVIVDMNKRELALLAQGDMTNDTGELNRLLQTAQRLLEEKGAGVIMAMLESEIPWASLSMANMQILRKLNELCPTQGELLTFPFTTSGPIHEGMPANLERTDIPRRLHELNEYLLTGQRDLYRESEAGLWNTVERDPDGQYAEVVFDMMKLLITSCLESFAGDCQLQMELLRQKEQRLRDYPDPMAAKEDLSGLSHMVFELQGKKADTRRQSIVDEVNAYIRAHLNEDIPLTRIAEATFFHPVYLSRIYKEKSGIGLSEFIREQRLNKACRLLRESKMKILEIAMETGFTSSGYFARFFRKHKGISPQEYRDMVKETGSHAIL